MLNADVIDLYSRVDVGTKIIVLPNYHNVAAFAPQMSHPGLWINAAMCQRDGTTRPEFYNRRSVSELLRPRHIGLCGDRDFLRYHRNPRHSAIIAKSRDHSHQDAIHAAGSSGARLVSPLGHLD
jgi:hypothetical protein